MTTVGQQIESVDSAICQNIASLANDRPLLAQNIVAQLRNLVEAIAVRLHTESDNTAFDYSLVGSALDYVKAHGRLNFLGRFHKLLQISASHYTVDGDGAERLMLKYFEYLQRIRTLMLEQCGTAILVNLESFPVDLDPSLREYHEKIAARIAEPHNAAAALVRARFYIRGTRPFFVDGRVCYEVTLQPAINRASKFDRIIAFTSIDMTDKYAAMLALNRDEIVVLGQAMPITIIHSWEVSIRPCEFNNFARLVGLTSQVRTDSAEYRYLMNWLTTRAGSLLDVVDMGDARYAELRAAATASNTKAQIFPALDTARRVVRSGAPGHNVLRYLLLRMNNQIVKLPYAWQECERLSGLRLQYGCIPFDTMPLCTSLPGHNPSYWDLAESIGVAGRDHELLARRVQNNVEQRGFLYTPTIEVEHFGDVGELVAAYNQALYYKHVGRRLVLDKGHVFIKEYEDDTVTIIEALQQHASSGIAGYSTAVERWLDETLHGIDDELKMTALKNLFSESRVAVVYGAAGTGKSTMVAHIATYFSDYDKLFLAHTNPAVDNLKRRVKARNSEFRTISSHLYRQDDSEYDLLVIDECSTVSNKDFLRVLTETSFKLVVLVGDAYQIESIRFGNWFAMARSFIPSGSVFELTAPYRTKSQALLTFWDRVRHVDDGIAESMARNGYSRVLDESLFEPMQPDEIILCLNYDGLYGINNINTFLQSSNPNTEYVWKATSYKVGDPVLFTDAERFRPLIYNNLKGRIVGVEVQRGQIQFDIDLDRPVSEFDVFNGDLEWMGGSVVRFAVFDYDVSDDDDDSLNTSVPFQVAYAVSIHRAQGLEFDSVKIVVTDANEDDVTHSIFYTAITRARETLRIFWTPETQHAVLQKLERRSNAKDVALLSARRAIKRATV